MTTPDTPERWTWSQLADELRRRIELGYIASGERLPTRRQLMADYGVADRTVARAVQHLRDEGYLLARSTAGWIVRGERPVIRSTRSTHGRLSRAERAAGRGTFSSDCHQAGITPDVATDVWTEVAREEVAASLGLDAGAEVCVRDRTMRGDGVVLQLATSYLPRTLTEGTVIEQADSGPGGIYARLEEAGHPLTSFTEHVVIGRADESEARQMSINAGEPVYRVTRTAWSGDTPVEVNRITITGDRYELVYELPAT